MQLRIDVKGQVHCLYSEQIELTALGDLRIQRASQVEPDGQGKWWADLAPVDGPRLGPYERRSQALRAEEDWLQIHWLDGSSAPKSGLLEAQ
jgi:hypothetical protein